MDINLLALAVYLYILVVIVTLVSEERDPSTTLAWILVLVLVPVLGIVLYILFGRDQRKPGARDVRRREAARLAADVLKPLRERYVVSADFASDSLYAGVARAITRLNGTTPIPCANLEVLTRGADKFERLVRDIEESREFVHLQYFIWQEDELTGRVCELLERKIAEGVEVRVFYDWVGSAPYGKGQLRRLASAGALVRPDRADWRKLNYRNHRKCVIVDGRVGYTGGMNMGREYVDGGQRFAAWRDTHVRFEGPLVSDLHALFCARWYRVTGENLFTGRYFPEHELDADSRLVWSQLAFSGPESEWEALRHTLHVAIARATRSVYVQSPYFVPDQTIGDALCAQAFAGVDVRLMMAGVHDKRLPWWAAFSYLDELVLSGGRSLQYVEGFLHAKTLTVDGRLASIGTTNFDIRSFALHDELQLFFYDEGVAGAHEAIFAQDATRCTEITIEALGDIPSRLRLRNAAARLFSRAL